MGKFAKIIDLENDEQVLVQMGTNKDNGLPIVVLTTEHDDVFVAFTLSFYTEDEAFKCFEGYGLEAARRFREDVEKIHRI